MSWLTWRQYRLQGAVAGTLLAALAALLVATWIPMASQWGYAVFAVALGIATGALIRRVVPAIGVTLVGFVAVRATFDLWLRPHYLAAVTHVCPRRRADRGQLRGHQPPRRLARPWPVPGPVPAVADSGGGRLRR